MGFTGVITYKPLIGVKYHPSYNWYLGPPCCFVMWKIWGDSSWSPLLLAHQSDVWRSWGCLEDHPSGCKLGSPSFISQVFRPWMEGVQNNPIRSGDLLSMVCLSTETKWDDPLSGGESDRVLCVEILKSGWKSVFMERISGFTRSKQSLDGEWRCFFVFGPGVIW